MGPIVSVLHAAATTVVATAVVFVGARLLGSLLS